MSFDVAAVRSWLRVQSLRVGESELEECALTMRRLRPERIQKRCCDEWCAERMDKLKASCCALCVSLEQCDREAVSRFEFQLGERLSISQMHARVRRVALRLGGRNRRHVLHYVHAGAIRVDKRKTDIALRGTRLGIDLLNERSQLAQGRIAP